MGREIGFAWLVVLGGMLVARPASSQVESDREAVRRVQNRTAAVRLAAGWGTDYLLLGRFGNRWTIGSVLWQSPSKS